MRSRLTHTCPVKSAAQSHSATVPSTISSIDSIWSGSNVSPTSSAAPSLSTAARGSMVFTRTPVPCSSAARPFVIRFSAAFDAPYIVSVVPCEPSWNGGPRQCLELALERFTIQPSPASRIAGAADWARSSGAWTFTSNRMRRRFIGISRTGM